MELEPEILLEGVRSVDGGCEQARPDTRRFVVKGVNPEMRRESTGLDHRQNEYPFSATRSEDGKGRRDRRLADTTLAGDDEKSAFEHAIRVAGPVAWTHTEARLSGTLRPQTERRPDGPTER